MTVLLIEDDIWLNDLYRDVLQQAGHQVATATDAQHGLDALDDHEVQVIVLDIMLPGLNGIGLLHHIRSYADLCHIPVIIHSAVAPAECGLTPKDWQAYGVVAYVPKVAAKPHRLVQAVNGVVVK